MEFAEYRYQIEQGSKEAGGKVVSLAGGYLGIEVPVDGANLVFALDLDDDNGWAVWAEDRRGERCCDRAEELGVLPQGGLLQSALRAMASHKHAR